MNPSMASSAVARVVMNRAASGKYPPELVRDNQAAVAILVRSHGQFPAVDNNCDAWRKAEAIARLAAANIVPSVSTNVLWYHADYVAPSWRRNLTEERKIGSAHLLPRLSLEHSACRRRPGTGPGAPFPFDPRFGARPGRLGVNSVHGGFARDSIRATIKSRIFLSESPLRGGRRGCSGS